VSVLFRPCLYDCVLFDTLVIARSWWYWCTGPDYGGPYPQYWLNSLVEWPAIAGRLLMWLTALNSVTGLLFWSDDVWAGEANGCGFGGCIYAGWKPPRACCWPSAAGQWTNCTSGCLGQPGSARQGPGMWVHRTYENGTCAVAGQQHLPTTGTDPRPMCEWQDTTMYTDGLCSSVGGELSNGDGSWMFPGPMGAPLSSVRCETAAHLASRRM
jgi:hypothetical protein